MRAAGLPAMYTVLDQEGRVWAMYSGSLATRPRLSVGPYLISQPVGANRQVPSGEEPDTPSMLSPITPTRPIKPSQRFVGQQLYPVPTNDDADVAQPISFVPLEGDQAVDTAINPKFGIVAIGLTQYISIIPRLPC